MAFQLQAGQSANLTFKSNVPGAQVQNLRFDVVPVQALPNFPLSIYGDGFPSGFTNTGVFADFFDLLGYEHVPPPWQPSGWQLMIHKTVNAAGPNVYVYGWGAGQVLWQITVTLV